MYMRIKSKVSKLARVAILEIFTNKNYYKKNKEFTDAFNSFKFHKNCRISCMCEWGRIKIA